MDGAVGKVGGEQAHATTAGGRPALASTEGPTVRTGTGRMSQYLLRHGAEEKGAKQAAAVGAQHDEVDVRSSMMPEISARRCPASTRYRADTCGEAQILEMPARLSRRFSLRQSVSNGTGSIGMGTWVPGERHASRSAWHRSAWPWPGHGERVLRCVGKVGCEQDVLEGHTRGEIGCHGTPPRASYGTSLIFCTPTTPGRSDYSHGTV